MCIQKNFLCKNENQNKPNGASPPIPSLHLPIIMTPPFFNYIEASDIPGHIKDST